VILDTKGNIFGGFTPVAWEKQTAYPCTKADRSLKSFLFTLKNPHNVPARRFALKAEHKKEAIVCRPDWGPSFRDIYISNECNSNSNSNTEYFGLSYANDTGLYGTTFFTGSQQFKVKEIEVFEITD
jgi:hypothetical protein